MLSCFHNHFLHRILITRLLFPWNSVPSLSCNGLITRHMLGFQPVNLIYFIFCSRRLLLRQSTVQQPLRWRILEAIILAIAWQLNRAIKLRTLMQVERYGNSVRGLLQKAPHIVKISLGKHIDLVALGICWILSYFEYINKDLYCMIYSLYYIVVLCLFRYSCSELLLHISVARYPSIMTSSNLKKFLWRLSVKKMWRFFWSIMYLGCVIFARWRKIRQKENLSIPHRIIKLLGKKRTLEQTKVRRDTD